MNRRPCIPLSLRRDNLTADYKTEKGRRVGDGERELAGSFLHDNPPGFFLCSWATTTRQPALAVMHSAEKTTHRNTGAKHTLDPVPSSHVHYRRRGSNMTSGLANRRGTLSTTD